jgi:hypothetical protein
MIARSRQIRVKLRQMNEYSVALTVPASVRTIYGIKPDQEYILTVGLDKTLRFIPVQKEK